jgi:ectoine hydroxylase-related dioxygenase (phytanoyl-CoA dioxygenase family)
MIHSATRAFTLPEPVTLPVLDGHIELPSTRIEAFRRDGHIKIESFFTAAEVRSYRPHLNHAIDEALQDRRLVAEGIVEAGNGWKYVKNVWSLSDITRRFVTSLRLGALAADLMGCSSVRLFRDQSYYKEPGGSCTPWHQDASFIPLDTNACVAIWIPLVCISRAMAPMDYATGSHRAGSFLGVCGTADAEMDAFEAGLRTQGYSIANYDSFEVGDIAVHFAATMHGSRVNRSSQRREVLVIACYPDGTRVSGDLPASDAGPDMERFINLARAKNREMVMPGLVPGDIAEGDALPLIYRRDEQP